MSSWKDTLIKACAPFDIAFSEKQLNNLETYLNMLLETNKSMNLTAITDPNQAAVLHFADSLSILKYVDIPQNASLIDVGTGAGFPGMPLKIMRNDIELTLLDSLNKRLNFLSSVLNELGLSGQTLHSRAEDAGRNKSHREQYDFATARAVAKLNVLIEYCVPLLKVGGSFIAMKADSAEEEIELSKNALTQLNCQITDVHSFELTDGSKRSLIIIKKLSQNDTRYPRNSAKISKKPL